MVINIPKQMHYAIMQYCSIFSVYVMRYDRLLAYYNAFRYHAAHLHFDVIIIPISTGKIEK